MSTEPQSDGSDVEAAHTPGPWKQCPTDPFSIEQERRDGPCSPHLASVRQREWTTYQAIANARLIAAAPELLDACEIMLSIWIRPGYPRKHPFIIDGGCPEKLLRTAIDKATGDTSEAEEQAY